MVHTIVIDPVSPNVLYTGTVTGVFNSTNRGRQWASTSSGVFRQDVFSLALNPANPNILYAGSSSLYKSTDAGVNWVQVSLSPSGGRITSIAIDPSQPHILYASSFGSVHRSTDAGDHWTRLPVQTETQSFLVFAVAVAPSSPNIVYAATSFGGVFRSADRGATWSQINDGLLNLDTRSLAIDPLDANTVYVHKTPAARVRSRLNAARPCV